MRDMTRHRLIAATLAAGTLRLRDPRSLGGRSDVVAQSQWYMPLWGSESSLYLPRLPTQRLARGSHCSTPDLPADYCRRHLELGETSDPTRSRSAILLRQPCLPGGFWRCPGASGASRLCWRQCRCRAEHQPGLAQSETVWSIAYQGVAGLSVSGRVAHRLKSNTAISPPRTSWRCLRSRVRSGLSVARRDVRIDLGFDTRAPTSTPSIVIQHPRLNHALGRSSF